MISSRIPIALLAILCPLLHCPSYGQAVWPSFLGQGSSADLQANHLPLKWSPTENQRWKAQLPGKGQSSPVIWGDTVYVTSIAGSMKETCCVTALSLATGAEKWTRTFSSSQPVRSNYFQSRSAPTPLVHSLGVVAFFETGDLVCLNRETGKIQWKRSLTEEFGAFESTIGLATSPVGYGDRFFLMIDHEGESYLLAADVKSGATLWRTPRFSRRSYATPAIVRIGDQDHLVCSSDGSVDGYDVDTGKQVWTFEDIGANTLNTPLQVDNGT
ncbi:MAG: PQQ-like beta-propeller repeat protein, partial [Pirellulales bacterium]|nr:PQQ-like beta-propeller repeat protein [Pirellulales bacterium]